MTNWIPTSKQLPENDTRVLTTIKTPHRTAVRSGYYDKGLFMNDNGDCWKATDEEVKAWKPLPEPYKENEDEIQC